MRGLLSCRVLKGPSGAERLSKSLSRHFKRHKRPKRVPFGRPNTLLQTESLGTAAEKGTEGKEQEDNASVSGARAAHDVTHTDDNHDDVKYNRINDANDDNDDVGGHAGDCFFGASAAHGVTHTDDNDDYAKFNISNYANDGSNDVRDHLAAVRNTGNGLKKGKDLHVVGIREYDNRVTYFDASGADEKVTLIRASAEESLLLSLAEDNREDSLHATPHAFDNSYKHSIKASISLEHHENNPHLQEGDVASHISDHPKGPIILPDWEAVMSTIVETPAAISLICGGKNTGKSTFARYLINSLLNRYGKVGFLDTDVGQPEFTPSGCLSLHVLDKPIIGLPILEMKEPVRCYFFGDISPKSDPEGYLSSVYSLYNHFKNKYTVSHVGSKVGVLENGGFPLVINTHGWIQGVGLDVLIKMIQYVLPTHIVQTVSKVATRNLPLHRFWESSTTTPFNAQLLYINNALGDNTYLAEIKYDARELRDLRLLSYFQRSIIDKFMPTSRLSSLFEMAATALACCKPFQVPTSAINVVQQHFQVPAGEILYSLNATLIGLGVREENEQHTKPWCVGLGIVRAVDVSRGLFYIISPLKLDALQRVNTFLQGKIEIPASFLKAPRYVSPYLCKNTIAMEGTGSAAMGKGKKKVLRMLRPPGIS